jgi:hypothetical protein
LRNCENIYKYSESNNIKFGKRYVFGIYFIESGSNNEQKERKAALNHTGQQDEDRKTNQNKK